MEHVIRVERVSHRYGEIVALEEVEFAVAHGLFFALLGPNGAGKTTLVHILCTLLRPTAGDAYVAGFSVRRFPDRVRRQLGLVFQEPSLDDRLTVFENLDFHARIYGVPRREFAHRVEELLELVELAPRRNVQVRWLSRGMKRRLEVARAMLHRPAVLVLDEPTVGLDVQTRRRLWEYVAQLRRREGVTLVLTTHYIAEAEAADVVAILDRGRLVALGTPRELKRRGMGGVGAGEEARSLEDVFVELTGEAPRDGVSLGREALWAFGQRGGEFTR